MKQIKFTLDILIRYILALFIGLNLSLIYFIFTPLTFYPVYFILSLFFNTTLNYPAFTIGLKTISLIPACVSGTAIYLLIILNLTIKIPLKKRIYSLLYSLSLFLFINILRIIFLSILLINSLAFYNLAHKVFWYALSTVFILIIWFSEVKIFKINKIPLYSDIKLLQRNICKSR